MVLEFSTKIDDEFSGDFLIGTTTKAPIDSEHSGSGFGDETTTLIDDEFSGMFATILFERESTTSTPTPTPTEMITGEIFIFLNCIISSKSTQYLQFCQ